jgi:hypothetical protein
MAHRTLSPAFAAAVERARTAARAAGELRDEPVGIAKPPFDASQREVVAAWRASGGYDRIVAEIVADDPELAPP